MRIKNEPKDRRDVIVLLEIRNSLRLASDSESESPLLSVPLFPPPSLSENTCLNSNLLEMFELLFLFSLSEI